MIYSVNNNNHNVDVHNDLNDFSFFGFFEVGATFGQLPGRNRTIHKNQIHLKKIMPDSLQME